ncbi:MAG TPA: YfiR family protein [Burkholderiaceae bacterium]|nr:YfiR family protein [Burkholderiaceae bacterium]
MKCPRLCSLVLLAFMTLSAFAADSMQLKAAIVYNILLFVEWPREAITGPSIVLCIDQTAPARSALRSLAGSPVRQYRLELQELAAGEPPVHCQALFVDSSAPPLPLTVRNQLKGLPVLVIAEERAAGDDVTAIRLVESEGRMAFEVGLPTIRRARLQLSSHLLRLARRVSE